MQHMDDNVLKNEFLLSTKDTAIQVLLLKQCSNLLIVGAVPFVRWILHTVEKKVRITVVCYLIKIKMFILTKWRFQWIPI